jgi:hypothetical protein
MHESAIVCKKINNLSLFKLKRVVEAHKQQIIDFIVKINLNYHKVSFANN